MAVPLLTLQTATLYASGDGSTFTGTGGPWGFSPFTGEFGGIVSSAGLAGEPFNDTVYDVAAGDEIIVVIAVQDVAVGAAAYGVRVREAMPTGFIIPSEGLQLTVTDGTGTDLPVTGDLFSSAGILIGTPVGGYDANSGLNVALVTFSLLAGPALPGPYASVSASASLAGYAATQGGVDLSAAHPASATTTIVTAAPTPVVTAETSPAAVARGQLVSFDVALSMPTGTLQDLRISPVVAAGASTLDLVSTSVLSVGAGLSTGVPTVLSDGSVSFGTVTRATSATGDPSLTLRVTVRADGTASGTATLQTVVSAVDPNNAAARWSVAVSSAVGVVVPPPPPTLSGLPGTLQVSASGTLLPFGGLKIGDSDLTQRGTLAISLLDGTIGHIGGPSSGSVDAAGDTFVMIGSLASLQAAAQQVTFTAGGSGSAHFAITVIDAAGGTVQDSSTAVSINPDPLFDAAYYLFKNPDVAAAHVDPYQHYLQYGWKEGRDPSAGFSTSFYLQHNPDVAAAGVNPLLHFETFGWKEGRDPDPLFDTRFYLQQNPDVAAAGVNPLVHYETSGWREGRDPSLLFSDSGYLNQNPDVMAANVDPLLHYIVNGRGEGRADPLAGGALPADTLVNAAYYDAQLGATLIPSGKGASQQAAWSYNAIGWMRGLNPDAWFDTNYYLSHNPDVAAAHINPLLHFEVYGWREGRNPSAAFSVQKYLAAYPDVRAANFDPLLHYILNGQSEGRTAFAV